MYAYLETIYLWLMMIYSVYKIYKQKYIFVIENAGIV